MLEQSLHLDWTEVKEPLGFAATALASGSRWCPDSAGSTAVAMGTLVNTEIMRGKQLFIPYVPLIHWYLIFINIYLDLGVFLKTREIHYIHEVQKQKPRNGKITHKDRECTVIRYNYIYSNQLLLVPPLKTWIRRRNQGRVSQRRGLLWLVLHAAIAVNWEAQAFMSTAMYLMINQETAW